MVLLTLTLPKRPRIDWDGICQPLFGSFYIFFKFFSSTLPTSLIRDTFVVMKPVPPLAFGKQNDEPSEDYVRARRYMPLRKKGLRGTDLKPDFARTGISV